MKTKRKEKEKGRRKEEKRICLESNSGPAIHREKALLGHVEHTGSLAEILLLKPSALLNVNSKIFFRRI